MAKRIVIYTDGACLDNPGPGGWAAILRPASGPKEISGGEPATTNNRMELQAAIEALRQLEGRHEVELWTDSKYLCDGLQSWMPRWKANGWRRRAGKRNLPVQNLDLWQQLDQLASEHAVTIHWTAGHAGDPDNERCDQLANAAIETILRTTSRDELTRARRDQSWKNSPQKQDRLFDRRQS